VAVATELGVYPGATAMALTVVALTTGKIAN